MSPELSRVVVVVCVGLTLLVGALAWIISEITGLLRATREESYQMYSSLLSTQRALISAMNDAGRVADCSPGKPVPVSEKHKTHCIYPPQRPAE